MPWDLKRGGVSFIVALGSVASSRCTVSSGDGKAAARLAWVRLWADIDRQDRSMFTMFGAIRREGCSHRSTVTSRLRTEYQKVRVRYSRLHLGVGYYDADAGLMLVHPSNAYQPNHDNRKLK